MLWRTTSIVPSTFVAGDWYTHSEEDLDLTLHSEWGFCGFDSGFCNSKCQNTDKSQCNPVSRPTCSESTDAMSADVRIAYYGAWSAKRSCDAMQPETIPAGVLTHINVAFEFITADHEITDEVGHISGRVARLKNIYPGLRVNIAIGGWVFNDPPTQTRFSDTVSSVPNRHKFIKSLIGYMQKYALDGVDLDWEYPVADDRGGVPLDYSNFVLLCADIREAFDSYDPGWQLTLTLPASYWYLKGFDIKRLEKYVDWFNVMTYDIHGLWDQHNIWTGPFLKGHTNITEIEDGLDLLWRNDVSSKKVVMGFGFYGRGFTMEDMSCSTPPSCTFSGPGFAGDCTNEPGILSYNGKALNYATKLSSSVHYDEESSVKYMTFSGNQWVSYDDAQSFERKKKYMFSRCLKGLMIWELGLDTANNDALVGLFGAEAVEAGKRDTSLNPNERDKLALDLSAYTGQNCYVAPGCTNGIKGDSNSTCMAGYSSAETGHSLKQIQGDVLYAKICNEGEYHHICCPTKAMPKNCEWIGAPERSQFGCSGDCGASQFELTTDFSVDRYGKQQCGSGKRHLCCDSTEILRKCKWTSECDWSDSNNGNCKAGEKQVAKRYDKDDGGKSYCCPEDDALEDCKWANDADYFKGKWDGRSWGCEGVCHAKDCYAGSLEVTSASITEASMEVSQSDSAWNLCGYDVALCCAPPSRFTKDWPVNPAYLWSEAFSDKKDDVTWEWANNFGNNHKDTKPDNLEEDPGEDPYGFVMLDGPPGSIAQQFSKQFTVLSETEATNVVSRSFVTTNRTILDSTFEHSDEELLVYCNYPHDSHHCKEIFYKGAADTIIKLPPHIGEGPWARVVSMEPEHAPGDLPTWAIRKRELAGVERNGIYRLKIDYSFNLIKRDDGPVNMRVDYTNLQNYWDEVTDEKPSKHRHSSVSSDKHLAKRWWGAFTAWLDKLNHITKDGDGFLPMGVKKMFNIYSGRLQCVNPSGVTLNAGLDITAEVNLQMGTRYAYYFSGTVVPPHIIDTYIFIGAQPSVYAGIDIRGNAELGYESEVKKLIATITYPGLSIKGIATVGPSLDILGQIAGKITVSGNLKVGAKYTMDPIEMYMPNTDESRNKASSKIKFDKDTGLQPVFQAGVRATLSAELRITPRINCGIRVGGSIGPRKQPLVEAQVAVYVNTSVYFEAYATAETQGLTSNWEYGYKVELRWRIGLDAVAQLYLYGEWRTKEYYPVDWQTIPIYGPIVVTSSNDDSMRVRGLDSKPFWELSSDPLPNTVFGKVYAVPVAHEPASADLPLMTYNSTSGKFAMPANHSKNSNYSRRAVDGEEKEFMLGSFKCTTSPNSVCDSTNDLETRGLDPFRPRDWHETHRELEGRDDDIARDCPGKVPRLYCEFSSTPPTLNSSSQIIDNCAALFADMTLTGPAGSVTVPGICSSVRTMAQKTAIPDRVNPAQPLETHAAARTVSTPDIKRPLEGNGP
ncbi:hypothetical protein CC86DRAFT_435113 [Ophiobolus disseminans]|uniref:chitinase n=1 Tax=Ophiobolus disseminans TaxID=1469910 RepID=A0A6A6ZBH5_9PLEO|nr:hypothetical protein CC86DRAFT_435113 [Ophiobolus disseminans]